MEESLSLGTAALVLIAGWTPPGAPSLLPVALAAHPADRRRLVAEPDLMPLAVEELLRAYSPVTMARVVTQDRRVLRLPDEGREKCS